MVYSSEVEFYDFYKKCNETRNEVRDERGKLIAFEFLKVYSKEKKEKRWIKVKVSDTTIRARAGIYLNEKDFFKLLYDNCEVARAVRVYDGKIYEFVLNEKKYKTDKPKKIVTPFDFFEYKDFARITRDRFYSYDEKLRNGYFSGLQGKDDVNIFRVQHGIEGYDFYDIDINAAYPSCFDEALPCGKFYTPDEWQELDLKEREHFIKFYDIKIKKQDNYFNADIPPRPIEKYKNFDFLLTRNSLSMVVSEVRLDLIDEVYGEQSYTIRREYFCKVKKYTKAAKFVHFLYDLIQEKKRAGELDEADRLKVALNSFVGNFGRRDECQQIVGVERRNTSFASDCIFPVYSKKERKEVNNYLPLCIVINDIIARRLFDILTFWKILPLTWNTDGAVIAQKKNMYMPNEVRIGGVKSKKVDPLFLICKRIYARPVVVDMLDKKVLVGKNFYLCDNALFHDEVYKINTSRGFFNVVMTEKYPLKEWMGFDFRKNEIIIRYSDNAVYMSLMRKLARGSLSEAETRELNFIKKQIEKL